MTTHEAREPHVSIPAAEQTSDLGTISQYAIFQSANGHVTQDHHGIGVETYIGKPGDDSYSGIAIDLAKAFAAQRAELERLRAELVECRRILRKYCDWTTPHNHYRECRECRMQYGHAPECPWQKAMGEQ